MPLPADWPGGGGSSGWLATESRVMREVAGRIRELAAASHAAPGRPGALGGIRGLGGESGAWPTGRVVQHLHAQVREGMGEFHGALVAGLPAVAARLETSAATYESADRTSGQVIDRAGPAQAPSVVGPDGRF